MTLTNAQRAALQAAKDGAGHYWPNDRARLSLQVLERRGLVKFQPGKGWYITPAALALFGSITP